jgi:enoyl-CoA hydratase/carnithine racemase
MEAMSTFTLIRYEVQEHIAQITMARPPVNAINMQLAEEINAAYHQAGSDPQVRAVILTSAFDRAFSAGMDLHMTRGASGLDLRRFLEVFYFGMHDAQYRLGKPTIAAVNGPARAAGVTLAVSCDVIIASETTDFSYPEIDVGLIPAMHFVHLPRQIGRHQAFELLFAGTPISAREAQQRGLINRAVPPDQVLQEARRLARIFAHKSPVVMRLGRHAFMRANDFEYRRNIENIVETICNIIATEDSQEGLNAFVEKRPPNW